MAQLTPPARDLLEPPDNKVGISIQLNGTDDSARAVMDRTGIRFAGFKYSQEIPAYAFPPLEQIDATLSNAALLLDILPAGGWSAIADSDIDDLVQQCSSLNSHGRSVFLRLAPDMNVSWEPWGQKPLSFIRYWRRIRAALLSDIAVNATVMVWAPHNVF